MYKAQWILLSCFIFIFFANKISAQWVQCNSFGGKFILRFANIPDGTGGSHFFIGTQDSGVFVSTNSGANWSAAGLKYYTIESFAVSGNRIYTGTYGNSDGLFMSSNYGANWVNVSAGLPAYPIVKAMAVSGTNIFASEEGSVYLSTNYGTFWNSVSTGLPNNITIIKLIVVGTNIFAATGNKGVFLSSNNGASWVGVNNGLPFANGIVTMTAVGSNLIAGIHSLGAYLSTDNGTSWNVVNTGLTYDAANGIYDLITFGTKVFAATGNGVFLTTNNGTLWIPANTGLEYSTIAVGICGTTLFASTLYQELFNRPISEMTSIKERNISGYPAGYVLEQNYPNPFNPSTNIGFYIPKQSFVSLRIYNSIGQEVSKLISQKMEPGDYSVDWNASEFPSGIYYYRISSGDFVETKKLCLLK